MDGVCINHMSKSQNRTTAKRESDLLITSVITDCIGRHDVLLPNNYNNYNFPQKLKFQLKKSFNSHF